MMLGLNAADCQAAGARYEELRSEADRFRSAGSRGADAPAPSRGIGAARSGIGMLLARTRVRLHGAHAAPEVGRLAGTGAEGRAAA